MSRQPPGRATRLAPLMTLTLALAGCAPLAASAQTPAAPAVDPCAGLPRCYATGPIVAEVVQLIATQPQRNNHSVRVSVRFRNIGDQPIALGYKTNSGTMLDNLGHEYKVDWRYNEHVAGIGQVSKTKADPQFTLRPGEARTAVLNYTRYMGKTQLGTIFNPELVVAQLEPLPGNQVRTVGEYSVSFANIAPGNFGSAASSIDDAGRQLVEGLKSIFKQ
jgi:hypothetical protein